MESTNALFQTPLDGGAVRCDLCPRRCRIEDGRTGYCKVRRNQSGTLHALTYGHPVALQIDPIEKKPFAFFLPGSRTLSLGTFGCNLNCLFCQNSELSCGSYDEKKTGRYLAPREIVELALEKGVESIAYTYNEPTVWIEYVLDIARLARENGLRNLLVSNGYITREAAEMLYPRIDAANIDMKGFSEEFYREMCAGELAPVLDGCEFFRNGTGGHLELTNLVIPGKNDSPEMIGRYLDWVEAKLGKDTPLHFSAYFPCHRYFDSPPTPPELLYSIRDRALTRGFTRIRLGNLSS